MKDILDLGEIVSGPKQGKKYLRAFQSPLNPLIRSLPPSNEPYRIHFEAVGRNNYYNSATYDIIVKPKQTSRMEDKSDILIAGNSLSQ